VSFSEVIADLFKVPSHMLGGQKPVEQSARKAFIAEAGKSLHCLGRLAPASPNYGN
jgi:hypothetical protein